MTTDGLSKLSQLLDTTLDEKLKGVEQRLGKKITDEVRWVEQRLGDKVEDKLDETFRKYRDEVLTFKDAVIGEVKAMRENRLFTRASMTILATYPTEWRN